MFTTYFSLYQIWALVAVVVLHIISIYFFSINGNIKYALWLLVAGGFAARFVLVGFDPYFRMWDEQYHALVAKNMAENNFIPMLFKYTPLPYDTTNWTTNHIWLHKQPLFLWQMALSIKLLGNSVLAVRLPSVIMSSLLILLIFRVGKLIINERVGYLAALLYATCGYLLDFNTGVYNTDHNDIAFIFYITLSIWAYTEYKICNKTKYIWLIGLFAGCAVLNKWLVGMLVFSGWGISFLFTVEKSHKLTELKNILKALLTSVLVFLPWQIYIFKVFPTESKYEFAYNGRHFFEAVENHSGDVWFHFRQAVIQYGWVAAYILPLALFLLFYNTKNKAIRISYITYVVLVYLFFTLAKTKMYAFCLIVSPIMFLALGNLLDKTISFFYQKSKNIRLIKITELSLLIIISLFSMDFETLQHHHTNWIKNDSKAWERKHKTRITEFAQSIAKKYDVQKTVVVNCDETDNIPVMFFSGYTAYDKIPTFEEYTSLKKQGFKILYIDNYMPIPDYFKNDKDILFIINSKEQKIISIRAANGEYVCTSGNAVFADRDIASTWETFTLIVFSNNECVLRAYNNNFLCPELNNSNEITATRTSAGDWETFTIEYLENDLVAFKATNNKYISIDPNTQQLVANADIIGTNEKFKLAITDKN